MGLLSSKNRGAKYLLSVIHVFTKYAWVKPLTDTGPPWVIEKNKSKRKSD